MPGWLTFMAAALVAAGCFGLAWSALSRWLARQTLDELLAPRIKAGAAQADAERAVRTKAAERAVGVFVAAAAGSWLAAWTIFRLPIVATVCGVAGGAALPRLWRFLVADRARATLRRQMPEALGSISSALRAGRTLPLAVEEAAARTLDPLGSRLAEAARRLEHGEPVETVFGQLHRDLRFAETAMLEAAARALTVTGGNMAETLDTVAALAREREAARAEARAAVSEQTLVSAILAGLPAVVYWFISASDPRYFAPAFGDGWGQIKLLFLAIILPAAGGLLSWRIMAAGNGGEEV